MEKLEAPEYAMVAFLPENFLHKSVNEPFIQEIMSMVLNRKEWKPGNPDKFEPDYFCDGVPFEFKIASDRKKKKNYIQRFRSATYESEDIEDDIIQYIQASIQQKLSKQYAVPNVHLCVLCLIDLTDWVLDEYGSITHHLTDYIREDFFLWIKQQCIDTHKFNNVFVIFPDMFAKWWVWDILSGNKANITLSEQELLSSRYPFWMLKKKYEQLQQNATRTCIPKEESQ